MCDSGYQPSGTGMRMCVDGTEGMGMGEWNGDPVTCEGK